jgi:hypothetical protein
VQQRFGSLSDCDVDVEENYPNYRLAERGVDIRTERKMEMWKQRVDGHLSTLGQRLESDVGERAESKANASALVAGENIFNLMFAGNLIVSLYN